MRLGHVVEGHDAPAEGEEEVGAEGDEGPEGELRGGLLASARGEREGEGESRMERWGVE